MVRAGVCTKKIKAKARKNGGGAAVASVLQFYTGESGGFKVSPEVVICSSVGFIVCVFILHAISKFVLAASKS